MMKAATRIVLPHFAAERKTLRAAVLVARSRHHPAQCHATAWARLIPGINGPSGMAGTRNADTMLGELLAALKAAGPGQDHRCLRHRRSRLHHHQPCQRHQPSAHSIRCAAGDLPHGFLAVDLASALGLPLSIRAGKRRWISAMAASRQRLGLLGSDPAHPDVVVAANGGSDLIYLPRRQCQGTGGRRIVEFPGRARIMSAACSSMTGWARFPAPCR